MIALFFFPLLADAQAKFDDTWLFGNNFGDSIQGFGGTMLKFATNPPIASYFDIPFALDASATISDSLGNLLFYFNGCQIANRQHAIMENGDGINVAALLTHKPVRWGMVTIPNRARWRCLTRATPRSTFCCISIARANKG